MATDPGNMPFQRVQTFDAAGADAVPAPDKTPTRHAESILMQEFNHANVAAYQAKEERARVFNLYIVQLGILISALVTLETIYALHPNSGLTVVGIVVGMFSTVVSLAYFARLFSLATMVHDSTIAMNLIKQFYLHQLKHQMPQLEQAFHWRLFPACSTERTGKMPLVMRFGLALSGSASFAFAIYLFVFLRAELALSSGSFVPMTLSDILVIVLAFAVCLVMFEALYVVLAHRPDPTTMLQREANKLGLVVPRATEHHERGS